MEKVIVSKEKCLHCLYGVTGECEMYDEMGKPMDGETCSNYEEAGEDEMAEGERLANLTRGQARCDRTSTLRCCPPTR